MAIKKWVEIDFMEYSSDANAQAAYVTNGATTYQSQYPPAYSTTYVKATTEFFAAYLATDPAVSLTGTWINQGWMSGDYVITNQRFHIDLGSAKVISRIYYENGHNSGNTSGEGAKNFTFWGSNTAGSFAELTYATDTGWTQITPAQTTFDQHTASDVADPKYITVTNTTAYRYYAFKFADIYSGTNQMVVRRIELQQSALQSYSEATIKTQGSYALKAVASITDSLNKTLTKTVSTIDLSGVDLIKFDMRATATGANIKLGLVDAGATSIFVPTITTTGWERQLWDISAIPDASKDAITSIVFTVTSATTANTFYIDNLVYQKK